VVTAVTRVENGIERAGFEITADQVNLIRQTVGNDLSDLELSLFLNQARARQLDPLTRQIYAIKMQGRLQIFASIDGLRIIAQRSGQYAGQVGPLWCGDDGEWTDVWLQQEIPAAAKVGVWRTGFVEPTWGVATFASFGKNKNTPTWKGMPDVMLAKCAESIALRKAFPDDLSGLYVREEFADAEHAETPPGSYRRARGIAPALPDAEPAEVVIRRLRDEEDAGEIIDADTGEIVQESFVQPPVQAAAGRMTKEQGQLIKDIGGQLGWGKEEIAAFSGEVTGLTNAALLREDQAKDLIQHLLAELHARKGVPM
jgi:phage recombination protein Bet